MKPEELGEEIAVELQAIEVTIDELMALFQRFCSPGYPLLPVLFDQSLAAEMAPYRRFRHVVFHGYGFQLEWTRMQEGITHVDRVFSRIRVRLSNYVRSLSSQS